jgi:hypothetical protein
VRTAILVLVSLMALASGTAQADMLTGREIRASVSGARIVGVNENESPYTILLRPGGSMKGILGKLKQFDDRGRWWVEGDKLCMHWELWLLGKPTCYDVEVSGDQITRFDLEERVIIRSTLVR